MMEKKTRWTMVKKVGAKELRAINSYSYLTTVLIEI
jgi:hypothetical protein